MLQRKGLQEGHVVRTIDIEYNLGGIISFRLEGSQRKTGCRN